MNDLTPSDDELISELIQLPHWQAFLRLVQARKMHYEGEVRRPALDFPNDFYRRDQAAAALTAIERIISETHQRGERFLDREGDG